MPYIGPEYTKTAFNCPHCNAFAKQHWRQLHITVQVSHTLGTAALCDHCNDFSIWVNKFMVYPVVDGVPNPHADMPQDIAIDYNEARSIASRSPRSAAALLRLAIEKLTDALLGDDKGKDLNDNIRILVQRGLPGRVQKALDLLRVIGNNAVHPGKIELTDNRKMANSLFDILNMIVDNMITEPRKISEMFDTLPEKDKANIKKRDNKQAK
jgi:hypothetical protein